ncbi:MAG: hypothetical protein GF383_08160 [Candidatus Lokiarchaeota archaeon]|nr:hypothetical protein [Candidatus Lokiarchaeota archaeon]
MSKTLKNSSLNFTEEELQLIAEFAIDKIAQKIEQEDPQSAIMNNYFKMFEPKKKVIEQKEFSIGISVAGWIILSLCAWYWIFFFFIMKDFEPLTYTTYITLILISLTLINRFESTLLNSITSISVYGFFTITLWLIPVSSDFWGWMTGPILHGAMAGFQMYLVFHRKIAVSKRYIIWGFLFYIIFLSSYDTFARLNIITDTQNIFPELMTAVFSFYTLGLTSIMLYFYKKKFGILLP